MPPQSSIKVDLSSPFYDGGETFYVRVSLGHLTGLKVARLTKKKKNKGKSNNALIVGYASLASTGKQIAHSQPFAPDLFDAFEQKTAKLIWTGSSSSAINEKRRRLYFSLQLKKESIASIDRRDDDSVASFAPKVVKLEIGLKNGDVKLPKEVILISLLLFLLRKGHKFSINGMP